MMLVPTAGALLILLLIEVESSKPGLNQNDSVQIIEENKLAHTSNPDAFMEVNQRKLPGSNDEKATLKLSGSPSSSLGSWEAQTLNKKLMEVKLSEKSRLKTNVNVYESGDNGGVQSEDNTVGDSVQDNSPVSIGAPVTKTGSDSASSLFQQIAAVSQMKNRYKSSTSSDRNNTRSKIRDGPGTSSLVVIPTKSSPETPASLLNTKLRVVSSVKSSKSDPGQRDSSEVKVHSAEQNKPDRKAPNMDEKKVTSSTSPADSTTRHARHLQDEFTRPLYGVRAYGEVTPIKLVKRSIATAGDKVNAFKPLKKTLKKGVKKQPKRHRNHSHGKKSHRKVRSINTDHISRKDKEVDFITAVKSGQPPPIVRVIPNDPIYYRHGRADEKQYVQSYDRDVQELIRHNVQHYVQSNQFEVSPNGQNDYLNRAEGQGRNGNQRRIVYYATLPEIVRRPNAVPLQESPYWTNYMVPRELSGSSNLENDVIKVQSTMLDVRDPSKTLIPVQTISPEDASSRSDIIQPAPYHTGGYPMRHNRYPPPELPPFRPINYDLANPNTGRAQLISNNIPTVIPKHLEIHSPKSYEVNGKRYGIYDIPTLEDNAIKPLYDDRSNENNKFTNYEKFYNIPGTFSKHIDYFEDNSGALDADFDWPAGPLGANSKSSYSLKYVPSSANLPSSLYLPHEVKLDRKQSEPAVSTSYKKDVVGKHSSNVIHSVTIEASSDNGTSPAVHVMESNRTVTIEHNQ